MSHLDFFISWKEEKNILMEMLSNDDYKYRIKQYKFPSKLGNKIHNKPLEKWDSELDFLLTDVYKKHSKRIQKALEFYKSYWEKNDECFFNKIEKIFNKKIPVYKVLLSNYVTGISDWIGTNICTWAYYSKSRIKNSHSYYLLFEIILSEVFKKIREFKNEKEISDNNVWIISELVSFTILHQEWNFFDKMSRTYYEPIDILIPQARELYKNCKNIDSFIDSLIKIINK